MAKKANGGFCWFGCDFTGDFKKAILKKAKVQKNGENHEGKSEKDFETRRNWWQETD